MVRKGISTRSPTPPVHALLSTSRTRTKYPNSCLFRFDRRREAPPLLKTPVFLWHIQHRADTRLEDGVGRTSAESVRVGAQKLPTNATLIRYGTARHNQNTIAKAFRSEALFLGGIQSRLEENDVLPGAGDRPGDVYVSSSSACSVDEERPRKAYVPTDPACSEGAFTTAAFDVTVWGAVPDPCLSCAKLRRSCSEPGSIASGA